ncbi:MAG: hypothetical protein WCT03_22835 [Candidatus Obscuribacterales bacterium]
MSDEYRKVVQATKDNAEQIKKMVEEKKSVLSQFNIKANMRPSYSTNGSELSRQAETLQPLVIQNPGVKTNELLGQLVRQNSTLANELVAQRELLVSQNQLIALLAEGLHVVSADVQTLIKRVSPDDDAGNHSADQASVP